MKYREMRLSRVDGAKRSQRRPLRGLVIRVYEAQTNSLICHALTFLPTFLFLLLLLASFTPLLTLSTPVVCNFSPSSNRVNIFRVEPGESNLYILVCIYIYTQRGETKGKTSVYSKASCFRRREFLTLIIKIKFLDLGYEIIYSKVRKSKRNSFNSSIRIE